QEYKLLGVEALRVNLYWGGPSGVARKKRPANAVNPNDPAYDWTIYDAMVKQSAENRIKPVFSILWTPSWAGPAKNMAPRRTIDLRNFAFAAAKRYSGSFHPPPDRSARDGGERAEQPGLPEAAVSEDQPAQVPALEPADLRRDLQRDHVGRPPDRARRRESRLRRDRPAWKQQM